MGGWEQKFSLTFWTYMHQMHGTYFIWRKWYRCKSIMLSQNYIFFYWRFIYHMEVHIIFQSLLDSNIQVCMHNIGHVEYFLLILHNTTDRVMRKTTWYRFLIINGDAPGGGGGALTSQMGRGCRWGFKTGPCHKPLGAQKILPVTIYLTKNFHMHTLLQYCTPQIYPVRNLPERPSRPGGPGDTHARTAAGARIWACHKHCGRPAARTDASPRLVPSSQACHKRGWEALRSNPVINGVAR